MPSYSLRCHLRGDASNYFQTENGSFEQMCEMVSNVLCACASSWNLCERIEVTLRPTYLNPLLQLGSCATLAGSQVVLSVRERALLGHVLRFYKARSIQREVKQDRSPKKRRPPGYDDCDWDPYNPYCILTVDLPSMHEKVEAMQIVRDWLREHWPEGERHLGRAI